MSNGEGKGLKRRDLLLASSSFLAASTLSMTGLSTATQAQQSADGRKPNILVIFRRRHRGPADQRLHDGHDGLSHAEYRPYRQRRRPFH
jgi:hypothetical protein